jgi:hypothetical protein
MMNTTANYASYRLLSNGRCIGEISFPNNTVNANFGGVCFYDPVTGTFLGTTNVNGFVLERVE